jgi:hypothetical protein
MGERMRFRGRLRAALYTAMTPDGKVCTGCGLWKSFDAFCRGSASFGFSARCGSCRADAQRVYRAADPARCLRLQRAYTKSRLGHLMMAYHNMRGRTSGIQQAKAHLYEGLPLLPRRDFYRWALTDPVYDRLFARWAAAGYVTRLAPSVDRRDTDQGYVLGNIRWLTQSENSRRGAVTRNKVYGRDK